MGEVDIKVIAQRLVSLRKHLGERLGSNLTIQDLADKLGIPDYKMIRLEHGKGAMDSLVTVLLFYRTQNYNLDWILFADNATIPMMLPIADDLLIISEMVKKLSNQLKDGYSEITSQLNRMGYSPLEDKHFAPSGVETEAPEVFDFSS